jgi:diguanylate cyclase (GGDEF)-like protein/PAS domain S-box-containing protein
MAVAAGTGCASAAAAVAGSVSGGVSGGGPVSAAPVSNAVLFTALAATAAAVGCALQWARLSTLWRRERILLAQLRRTVDAELLTPEGVVVVPGNAAHGGEATRTGRHLWGLPPFAHDPSMRERVRKAVESAAAGDNATLEIDVPASYGETHTLELCIRPVLRRGRVRYLAASTLDVTRRRSAEHLKDDYARQRDFYLRNAPLAVIEWSADLRVRGWSRQAEILFGWSEAEALGRTSVELGMAAEGDRGGRGDLRQAGDGRPLPLTTRQFRRKDGTSVWAETLSSALRGGNGEVSSIVMMAHDVTDRHLEIIMLRDRERRYRSLVDNARTGLALLDAEGHWLQVNDEVARITGYGAEALLRLDFQSISDPEGLENELTLAREVMTGERDSYRIEKRYLRPDGSIAWVEQRVCRVDLGGTGCFVAVIDDIVERKAADARARAVAASLELEVQTRTAEIQEMMKLAQRQHAQLAVATEMNGLLPAAHDVGETAAIIARYMPQVFRGTAGALYFQDAASGQFLRQAHWGQAQRFNETVEVADCWALRRCQAHRAGSGEDPLRCRHLHPDTKGYVCLPLVALGEVVGLLELTWEEPNAEPDDALLQTVAEHSGLSISNLHLRDELRQQAFYDPLTGLYNRRSLDDHLRRRASEWARNRRGYALLMIDVDYFKSINDRFGHEAGDQVLREVSALLRRALRNHDAAFRHGGEEFLLVIECSGIDGALQCAERIRQEIETLRVAGNGQILPALTVSIGVACCPEDGEHPSTLRSHADQALYASKAAGRNRVMHFPGEGGPSSATA